MEHSAPSTEQPIEETIFEIIYSLNSKYIGLDPIKILNSDTKQVLDLWTDTIIYARNEKGTNSSSSPAKKEEKAERVYSYNATWH